MYHFALKRVALSEKTTTPTNILYHASQSQAKHPRDKFYGVLGLVGAHSVQVDYKKSVTDVYIESVLQTAAPGLRVLSHVGPLRDLD